MDAIKILGSLLSNNAMGSSVGQNVLGALLGGGGGNNSGAAGILGALLGGSQRQSGGGLGALGGILGAASSHGGGGGDALGVLGSLLGGGGGGGSSALGGLAGLLGGGQAQPQKKSGIAGLLGGLLGGGQKQAPQQQSGAGGLLGSLLGGGGGGDLAGLLGGAAQGGNASDMLGALLGGGGQQLQAPPKEAHSEAELLICAMCNAAKSDGQIDQAEKDAILGRLGDLDQEEVDFVREELSSPLDLDHFVNDVPADMTQQVYAFSLMAIKLDTQKEARYFGDLAQALRIDADTANGIHNQLGQPEIFA